MPKPAIEKMSLCRQIWNTPANQAVEFEFDPEAGQEITLKVMPIEKGIAQPVFTLPLEMPRQREMMLLKM